MAGARERVGGGALYFSHQHKHKKAKTQRTHARPSLTLLLPLHTHSLSPQGALVMPLMSRGFKRGTIKFVVVTARKPE